MRGAQRTLLEAAVCTTAVLFLGVPFALGATVSVSVPGTANPYLSGMPGGSTCCQGDSVPAQSPVQVQGLALTPGTQLTFTVTGSVSYLLGTPPVDPPDGSFFFKTAGANGTPSSNGISAMNAPVNALVGVFLGDGLPTASGPPPGLDFSQSGLGMSFPSLAPALKQVFFIGDGLTGNGTGAAQQFVVPVGATRLFLGSVDGIGWFTNSGAFSVQVTSSGTAAGGPLAAAVLPSSRSVQVGKTATAFATIINAGGGPAVGCGIALATSLPNTSFSYQTTDSATNAVIGQPNTPVDIPPGASQAFVMALTPQTAFSSTDVAFAFQCANGGTAQTISGVNTLLLTASDTPTADVITLAATLTHDAIVNIPGVGGTGAFAVATTNIGASGSITASADTGATALPIGLGLCQTNPATGDCLGQPTAALTLTMDAGSTPTFAVFAMGQGQTVPFNPALNRIFVRFKDATGVTRGASSVAVRTQ